jgi:hypothetical protein
MDGQFIQANYDQGHWLFQPIKKSLYIKLLYSGLSNISEVGGESLTFFTYQKVKIVLKKYRLCFGMAQVLA